MKLQKPTSSAATRHGTIIVIPTSYCIKHLGIIHAVMFSSLPKASQARYPRLCVDLSNIYYSEHKAYVMIFRGDCHSRSLIWKLLYQLSCTTSYTAKSFKNLSICVMNTVELYVLCSSNALT